MTQAGFWNKLGIGQQSTCSNRAERHPASSPLPASVPIMSKPQFFAYPKQGEVVRNLFWYSQSVRVGDRIEVSGQGKFIHQSHLES